MNLENHVWIYALEGDLDQVLVWLVIWFLWDCDIWKHCFQNIEEIDIKNKSEENKQRLKEHQKKYCKVKSSALKIFIFFCLHTIKMGDKSWFLVKKALLRNYFIKVNNQLILITKLTGKIGSFKYFIGYISNYGIIPLYIMLPKMHPFAKYFDRNLVIY